jgi:hypothetical protein
LPRHVGDSNFSVARGEGVAVGQHGRGRILERAGCAEIGEAATGNSPLQRKGFFRRIARVAADGNAIDTSACAQPAGNIAVVRSDFVAVGITESGAF